MAVDFIASYKTEMHPTLHGRNEDKKQAEVFKDKETEHSHILLISKRKLRKLREDCLEKQLLIEHVVKLLEREQRESIQNIFN